MKSFTGRFAAISVGAALLLAACGGSEAETPAESAAGTTAPASAEPTVQAATPATVTVGQTVWFAGFEVELGSATFDPEASTGPSVDVDARFTNLGSEPAVFDGTPSLASGGAFYEPSYAQELPTVPGLATGEGTFAFDVDESFTFDDATLTIGLAGINQAVVPLGERSEAITLEPSSLSIDGQTKAGAIAIALNDGELRTDVPATHEQIEAGYQAMTIGFDVTNHGSYAGGFAFSHGGNLALELPDGTTIAADDGPIELLTLGTTTPDQVVRFTIPEPVSGTYALVLIDDTIDKRSRVEFQL